MADQNRKRSRTALPLSRHALFPAVIALCVGALFGLGSLVLPIGLLETVVRVAHVDALVPAATPPLGMTARILLALGLIGAGIVTGGALARRIALLQPSQTAAKVKGAHAEAGPQVSASGRRRALSLNPIGMVQDGAGEPACAAPAEDAAEEPEREPERVVEPEAPDEKVLLLAEQDDDASRESVEHDGEPEGAVEGAAFLCQAEAEAALPAEWGLPAADEAAGVCGEEPARETAPLPVPEVPVALSRPVSGPSSLSPAIDALSYGELLDRLELALRQRGERLARRASAVAPAAATSAPTSVVMPGLTVQKPLTKQPVYLDPSLLPPDWTETQALEAGFVEYGTVEQDPLEQGFAEPEWPDGEDYGYSPLTDHAVAQPIEPHDWGAEDFNAEEDELARREFVTPRQIITPSFAALADCSDLDEEDEYDEEEDDEEENDKGYSSLLDFSRPSPLMKRACLRLEDVESEGTPFDPLAGYTGENGEFDPFGMPMADDERTLPEPAQSVSEEAEQALRAGLTGSQRMNGAG